MWNKGGVLVAVTVMWMVACGGVGAGEESLAQQCSTKVTAVMTCVDFATGKEPAPQKKCCDSVKEMKDSNPACLCFIIQQIHNGTNPMLKKMNIQESRLLQLSSACKIANASISDCPSNLISFFTYLTNKEIDVIQANSTRSIAISRICQSNSTRSKAISRI
ncbi:putative bifunctional inhibitor/plant lipid transfer protein/seed storage helical [Helianthus annuus]|nr:putative bifunctional inhibitor/plant lipid transfer protein/seed storage helical [Helianthus annuus]